MSERMSILVAAMGLDYLAQDLLSNGAPKVDVLNDALPPGFAKATAQERDEAFAQFQAALIEAEPDLDINDFTEVRIDEGSSDPIHLTINGVSFGPYRVGQEYALDDAQLATMKNSSAKFTILED